jgi:hypothetical protein
LSKTKNIPVLIFISLIILVIGVVVFSIYCLDNINEKQSNKLDSISTESKYLCRISNNSIIVKNGFSVIKILNDSIVRYKYLSVIDSLPNVNLEYQITTQNLYYDGTEYKLSKKNVLQSKLNPEIWFDIYELSEPEIDGMSPLMFNKEYGILVITSPLGPTLFFMTEPDDYSYANKIISSLLNI